MSYANEPDKSNLIDLLVLKDEEIDELKKEIINHKNTIEKLDNVINTAMTRIDDDAKGFDILQKENRHLKYILETYKADNQKMEAEIFSLEGRIESKDAELESLELDIRLLNENIDELEEEIEDLGDKLEQEKRDFDKAEEIIEELEILIAECEEKLPEFMEI